MSCVQEVSLGRMNLLVTNPQLSLLQVFASQSELCLLKNMAPGSQKNHWLSLSGKTSCNFILFLLCLTGSHR